MRDTWNRPSLWGVMALVVLITAALGETAPRVGWSLRLDIGGRGGWPEPVWVASDLEMLVRRLERDREAKIAEADRQGVFYRPPPLGTFPSWTRCQELALQHRPEMILIRVNMAGLKAARRLLKGGYGDSDEDSLGRNLPSWFSAERWGEEILRDFRLSGRSREKISRLLSQQLDGVTALFTEWRDRLNHEAAQASHSLERARLKGSEDAVRLACWKLWITMGCP
ncbi:MAG TPA: hypothetical protein PKO06_20730 [Candidatus Ozemobacteraceae bacterium]|nr:hypothetical protein [Candidatus Ozemobacteraceae bacterium]